MVKLTTCERCKAAYGAMTLNAAAVTLYAKCMFCCTATQTHVDANRLNALVMAAKAEVDKSPTRDQVFTVTIRTNKKKPIEALSDHVANRIWSLDGVVDVTAKEVEQC